MSLPLRFGPFEVHLAAGELRKDGRVVRIQEQPFQILVALLEHPGDVVTREQLRARLWPGDSFGEFDQGLNTAINKLREALGDSPSDPKYIETLPKRGYRFTATLAPPQVPPPPSPPDRRFLLLVTGLGCIVIGAMAGWYLHPSSTPPPLPSRHWTIQSQEPLRTYYPHSVGGSISPNGSHIVGVTLSTGSLWIHRLDETRGRVIAGTQGSLTPFWSPDGSLIAYVANNSLWKMPVEGGAAIRVASLPLDGDSYGGAWSLDGEWIVLAVGNPSRLYRIPAAEGSHPTPLLNPEAIQRAASLTPTTSPGYFWAPKFLPGDSRLAYTLGYLNSSIVIQDWKSGEAHILAEGTNPFFAASGHLLYTRPGSHQLWAQPVSPLGRKSGEAFRVSENCVHPSVSNDQTLACSEAPQQEHLAWFDRQGKRIQTLGRPASGIYYPALSPDGRRISMETLENANMDIWVLDAKLGTQIRLTTHLATDIVPTWASSGDQILFSSYRSGSVDVWMRSADAVSEERLLYGTPDNERVSDWSKDGKFILMSVAKAGQRDIQYLTRSEAGKWAAHSFLSTSASEHAAKFSADGNYVAYLSDESGRTELYVREFPTGDRKWIVSSNGATQPRWSRDGKEIFYVENGTLVAVPVVTQPTFSAGTPVRLFSHPVFARVESEPHYDLSLDRQQILVPDAVGETTTRIHIIQNWLSTRRK